MYELWQFCILIYINVFDNSRWSIETDKKSEEAEQNC